VNTARFGFRRAAGLCVLLALGLVAACGDDSDDGPSLTVYSGQHEDLVKDLADEFTDDTGIDVDVRSGNDAELSNQIIEEGGSSPADVFLSEVPDAVGVLDARGLLSPVDAAALNQVDPRLVPGTKNWMPYAARARVIYFNPELIPESELPTSLLDLADPKWKGRFAYAPGDGFPSTVAYLISSIGTDATLTWLKGIKANGVNERSNGQVRDSVEAGQHAFGISNHYYWWILANDKGDADELTSKLHYFDHPDAGSIVLASGAGVLKSAEHPVEAQRFLAWLSSPDGGQQVIAASENAQYPVAPGVQNEVGLQPLSEVHTPEVDQSVYANVGETRNLMSQAGLV
jgi:iron(III) transport system substrate-binding protein